MNGCKRKKLSRRCMQGIALLLSLGILGQPLTALAGKRFKPRRGIGKAGRRIGLATRGPCGVSPSAPNLTALVPKENNGLASTPSPTFAWLMPQHTFETVEFRLSHLDPVQNRRKLIYTTRLENPQKTQYQSFKLPVTTDAPRLIEGQDYRWDVILSCLSDDESQNLFVQGWVRYEKPEASFSQALATATPNQKFGLYAQNSYWYDGVEQLLQQKFGSPTNGEIHQTWTALMRQEEVQLDHLLNTTEPEVNLGIPSLSDEASRPDISSVPESAPENDMLPSLLP